MSPETARRLCEAVGKRVEETHTLEAKAPWKEEGRAQENEHRLAMSADGAMVPLTRGEGADVRTVAMGEVPPGTANREPVHVGERSSFSRLTDAAPVPDLAEVETRRRRLVQAKEVGAVRDGADWLQSFFSRLTDAAPVPDLAEVETRRQRLVQAKEVGAVRDGADWLQSFVEIHRADAVRGRDFPTRLSIWPNAWRR